MKSLLDHLQSKYQLKFTAINELSGGDISRVLKISTSEKDFILKLNHIDNLDMFKSEKFGLNLIDETELFRVPNIYSVDSFENLAYIMMEFIPTGNIAPMYYREFGNKLFQLHSYSSDAFGLNQDNYIGSLIQSNKNHNNWNEFYWFERILPQYQFALENNLISNKDIPDKDHFLDLIDEMFYKTEPSLLHGDLWNGNYMFSDKGEIVLIDPAVYYGHPMMDIGMSSLFGGFNSDFYISYKSNLIDAAKWEEQIELAQWYYLLVHLNIFGKQYLPNVNKIKDKYFYA